MKKLFLIALICIGALGASAEVRFQGLDNIRGTHIELVDNNAPQSVEVTKAVFLNNGKEYPAKEIRCNVVNGVATYNLKFKRCTLFKNCKVILTVNGQQIMVEIPNTNTAR